MSSERKLFPTVTIDGKELQPGHITAMRAALQWFVKHLENLPPDSEFAPLAQGWQMRSREVLYRLRVKT